MRKSIAMILVILTVLTTVFSAAGTAVFAAETDGEEYVEVGADKPQITAIEPCAEGIVVNWSRADGVSNYRVYRMNPARGWVALGDTTKLYFIDTNVSDGNTYQYRIAGISAEGSVITSTDSASIDYVAPPRVTSVETTADGILVRWNKPDSIHSVAVFRKSGGSGWKRVAENSETSYLDRDVADSGEYTYTVRALNADGSYTYAFYDETGVTVKRLSPPAITVQNGAGGVLINWGAVYGAEGYRVFVKRDGGSWSRLADTSDTSYLDTAAESGKSYTYTVRCITADGSSYTSYYDPGKSVDYIAAPKLLAASSTGDGIKISWEASAGAAAYRVFYRNSNGGWTRLGQTEGTSFVDSDVRSGGTYTYTVRCISSDGGKYTSYFYNEGVTGTFLSAPEITSLTCGAEGVNIAWGAVEGAEKYRVYYYGSKGWTRMLDTEDTSYVDKDVASGHTYKYTVRCINADGTAFTSGYLSGKSVYYIAAPTITSMTNTTEGVKITWAAETGAEKYRVYYYGRNGWTKMADTTSTSYVDADVSSGVTYTYTVRCLNSAGNAFTSYFKPGVKHTFIAAPQITALRWGDASVGITWGPVTGAELYRVYVRTDSGWKRIADTKENFYEDKDVVSGNTYTYTVRCLNADATAFTSGYRSGTSIKFLSTPHVTSVSQSGGNVTVKWGAVQGAVKYRVYYKTEGGSWTRLADTTDTTYVHQNIASGSSYTYTVRCINAAGTAFESGYDGSGEYLHYIAAPSGIKATPQADGVKVTWNASAGAEKYRVYYYGSKGWTKIADTADTSILHTDVTSGSTYRYTVRCISADGSKFTSDYDSAGVSCKYTDTPALKAASYAKNGIVISWGAVQGVDKYRVYYYGSKGWTKLTDTTSTSYTDTAVSSGHTYRYTVRCINEAGTAFTSSYDSKGVSLYYIEAPKLADMDISASRVTLYWTKPDAAEKFRVYKKINGSWSKLTDTTDTSYTDYDVEVGNTYIYTVRCINSDGTAFQSGFDPEGFIATVTSSTINFRYYDQTQYSYPYGDDTIAGSGCGPTCFAMVASTITGKEITPINAVEWCGNDYYVYGVGTMWSYFEAASNRFGVKYGGQTYSQEEAIAAMKKGKYVISSHGPGRFTSGGHFIVLAGLDANGKIIVFDPNGWNKYIGTSFTPAEIAESATSYWIFG